MSAVRRPKHEDYRYFIEDLSRELPMWSLEPRDLTLAPEELDLVIINYGGGDFVSEALGEQRNESGEDFFSVLATRATLGDINNAWVACGLAVMTAITAYATKLVVRDVNALRDRQSTPSYIDHASIC
jgi:hypothetical protein